MLRSSWQLVVAESVNRSELVPLRSYSATIANRTWGTGAWLVWRSPPDRPSRQLQANVPAESAAEGELSFTLETANVPAEPAAEGEASSTLVTLQAYIRKHLRENPGVTLFMQQIAKDRQFGDLEQRTILLYLIHVLSQDRDVLTPIRSSSGLVQALGYLLRY